MQESNEIALKTELNSVDKRIYNSVSTQKIKDISEVELSGYVSSLVKGISAMVGIKSIDETQVTLFYDFLRKYYSDLSISEIKLAFELSIIGELDKFLPLDKHGRADRNHYQMFSMEYVSKILTAYKRRSVNVKKEKQKALPRKKIDYKKLRIILKRDLVKDFDEYKNNGSEPFFVVGRVYCKYLIDAGLMEDLPEPTEEDYTKAEEAITRFKRKGNLVKLSDSFKVRSARRIAEKRAIINVFEQLINEGKNLEDVI